MSHPPISLSPDLTQLRDEGYAVEVRSGYLLVHNVPYVDAGKEVRRGTLVSVLTLAMGDVTTTPGSHQAYFIGGHPCDHEGAKLSKIEHSSGQQQFAEDVVVQHAFSAKPVDGAGTHHGYRDYHHLVTTYVALITGSAQRIDPTASALSHEAITSQEGDSVFNYSDSATTRAGIGMATRKLRVGKVAIVGLGGTGSYVLDLLAKTPIGEIHLFDGDDFLQHNAFRAPGAPAADQWQGATKKVAYFQGVYSKMRRGIIAHDHPVDASNVYELRDMDFAFVCIDGGEAKRIIVEHLEAYGLRFVDVGMGVGMAGDSLRGAVRVTTSTPEQRDHFRKWVSLADAAPNDYDRNIQIADLNALNAALAVIRWKKLCGFYLDFDREHHCVYTIDGNSLGNEDQRWNG